MAKRKFHMKQAEMAGNWIGLKFRTYIDSEKPAVALSDPIITSVCGDEIEYGKLFAYCFRRFGYPNRGWDDYKELVSYRLTTPHPDMVLRITPYVGNISVISVQFMVERGAYMAIEAYAERDRMAWEGRSLDYAEKQGLPNWMPEWVNIFNTEFRAAFPDVSYADNWRQAVNFYYQYGEKGSRPYELTDRLVQFRKKLHDDYAQIERWPAYYMRPADVKDWNEDDPLKPFAQAAMVALEDLRTPVGVRDQSINAFGEVESGRADVNVSPSAGYPSGALGNSAPKEFAELHTLILKLGKGNAKRGIKKAMLIIGDGAAK
ncbi:hypothetical protein RU820_05330 [Acidithiobacillus ferrooxidans]|uniref:Uncharacterized protein n=1 Tax=Acidithiobacillus ferrooxidans (strain ATCC 23270 / DSM 14882 / CIP 104768 / NCIMB 8455) TaxID=243159 RepID=B7J868_ACIF2|nr:hypothetical protein [Acidithiobacillus ferrooxidans]ACK78152.1 hypothetical protein AFE_1120 [Acidithiobacillus ferrooxidans ATCC 23270]